MQSYFADLPYPFILGGIGNHSRLSSIGCYIIITCNKCSCFLVNSPLVDIE